jgi:antitoxin HicB
METRMSKSFEYYMSLPYKIVLLPAEEGGYVVEIPELPGCITQGDNLEDAFKMINDAKAAWIDVALQEGIEISEPYTEEQYSGKYVVRIPKTLHRDLANKAKEEKVSLNQLTTYLLASGIGKKVKL